MSKNLTPRQKSAIATLAAGETVTRAAVSANVSRETIYKWLQQPAFQKALIETTDAALENVSRRLVALADAALETLETAMTDESTEPGPRIRAAAVVLQNVLAVVEQVTLNRRITELERKVGK